MTKEEAQLYLNVQIEALGDGIHAWTGPEMVDLPATPLLVLSAANPKGVKTTFSANRAASQKLATYLVTAGLRAYVNLWPTQEIIVGMNRLEGGCAVYLADPEQRAGLFNTARMFQQHYLYELTKEELRVLDALDGTVLASRPRGDSTTALEPETPVEPPQLPLPLQAEIYVPKGFDEL